MQSYNDVIDSVVMIVGDANGQMEMSIVFNKLGKLPIEVDGKELAFRLGKSFLKPYRNVEKGNWVLNDAGWKRYKELGCCRNEKEDKHEGNSSSGQTDEYYLSIFCLDNTATLADIKSRYRELTAQYHPDKVSHLGSKLKEVALREMKLINEAYEFLKKNFV